MTRFMGLLPYLLTLGLYLPHVSGSEWILDDSVLIQNHPAPGRVLPEWTAPAYEVAAGRASYVWRPAVTSLWRLTELVFPREPWVFRSLNLCLLLWVVVLVGQVARLVALRAGHTARLVPLVQGLVVVVPATMASVCWSSAAFELAAAGLGLVALRAALVGNALGFGLSLGLGLLAKETLLPGVFLAGFTPRPQQKGVGLAGIIAVLGYQLAHGLVTGIRPPGVDPLEAMSAWIQAVTLPVWAFYSPQAHLFDPHQVWLALPVVVGLCGLTVLKNELRAFVFCWFVLHLPVAFGVPLVGVLPARYGLIPLVLSVVWLVRLPELGRWGGWLLVAVGAWGVGARAGHWQSEQALWVGTLGLEPENAYAKRQWIRIRWAAGSTELRQQVLLPEWKKVVEDLPRPLAFFDPNQERFELAKGAFLVGEYGLALEQVQLYLTVSSDPQAWCLLADAAEQVGGYPDLVLLGSRRCFLLP